MNEIVISPGDGQRGLADHNVREQIVSAANDHFSHYGYEKTTVSDLSKAIGFSRAYIYKFFDSKQAIGEAICSRCLATILGAAQAAMADGESATDKYRKLFKSLVSSSTMLFFSDRRLYDIAAYSVAEKWKSWSDHNAKLLAILRTILLEGRESGEFERKTPLDETCRSILQVMQPFIDPLMLQHNLDLPPEAQGEVSNLVLRSLAP